MCLIVGLVLLLAKLCVHMETTTVLHVVEVLGSAFQSRAAFTSNDGLPRFVGGNVARRLGSTASESVDMCWLPHSLSQQAGAFVVRVP